MTSCRVLFSILVCGALGSTAGCGDDSSKTTQTTRGDASVRDAGKGSAKDAGKGSAKDAGKTSIGTGDPITAKEGTWTFIDFPNTHCRDGSTTGLAVSLRATTKKVMIFLEGGGACFDSLTCSMNPSNDATQRGEQTNGVFDRSNADNPVKDWSFVYIPYCTGDVHVGANDQGMVSGVTGTQHFVGRLNMQAFLERLVPTFADADQVLLTGVSAGGFGSAANTQLVRDAFDPIPVTVIDDSGPPMSSTYIPTCLQDKWRTTWGFDQSILKDCGDDCKNPSDYQIDFMRHLSKAGGDAMSGLIESNADGVITLFYGFGANNCNTFLPVALSADTFTAGLLDLRKTVMDEGYTRFGTYYITSTQHTWISGPSFYSTSVGGVRMVDWYKDLIEGKSAAHVGP